ncbi:MAG: glycogen synthase GlgA [Burkholderiales bacterium]|jgi:starch synthase|nr:glycogen synthase GlgA [Burkholderiales bacterium]
MSTEPLRVLFATPEAGPFVKTGGLGDVAGALPAALRALGADVRVLMPAYRGVATKLGAVREVGQTPRTAGAPPARILEGVAPNGVPLLLVDCPAFFDRPGGPYQDEHGADHVDNAFRFGLLSRVAASIGAAFSPIPWRAEVVHANDWQTALAPAYLRYAPDAAAASVVTIHNLAFQGIFAPGVVPLLGLPPESFSIDGIEYYGQMSFLKAGLFFANAITTVSPSYAREIQSEPLGFGLQGLLAGRRDVLHGILNGIDTTAWDPGRDPLIPSHFSATRLEAKAGNKTALRRRFGLDADPAVPVLTMVSRLTDQKGVDLLLEALAEILALPAQVAVVGTGEPSYERLLQTLAKRNRGRMGVLIGFDEALAHLAEAGADIFLMPSRFEPCGMNQMFSQRYGTVPVVHATGGLADSVTDTTPASLANGTATGFVFRAPKSAEFFEAVRRAVHAWGHRELWMRLQRNGMARDFSWTASAQRYLALYRDIARARRTVPAA